MDILIKNMEMPKDNKRIFLCIEKDGEVGVFEEKKLTRFTEAQELPPHGRLIDADGLMKKVREEADFPSYEWCKAIECLEEATTIVEATE